jgi:hypothetical protein
MQCDLCSKEFGSIESLRKHYGRKHNVSSQEFYNEFILNGNIPTCKCGCGEVPVFRGFVRGYGDWIRGHISRVKNNWGHNESAKENSSKTRREQFKSGDRKVWNDGLTKEVDNRVKLNGLGRKLAYTDEVKMEYSKRMSEYRKKGIIPTRYGKESANWKGGTSPINNLIRANKRLYDEWIYPILCEQGFKCQKCQSSNHLEVHHNTETMAEIIAKYVDKSEEYTFDEKREIMNTVIDYHISNNVSGEVLCRECHKQLHPSYNY